METCQDGDSFRCLAPLEAHSPRLAGAVGSAHCWAAAEGIEHTMGIISTMKWPLNEVSWV